MQFFSLSPSKYSKSEYITHINNFCFLGIPLKMNFYGAYLAFFAWRIIMGKLSKYFFLKIQAILYSKEASWSQEFNAKSENQIRPVSVEKLAKNYEKLTFSPKTLKFLSFMLISPDWVHGFYFRFLRWISGSKTLLLNIILPGFEAKIILTIFPL